MKTYIIKKTTDGIHEYFQNGDILAKGIKRLSWVRNPHQAKRYSTRNAADIDQHLFDLRGRVVCAR